MYLRFGAKGGHKEPLIPNLSSAIAQDIIQLAISKASAITNNKPILKALRNTIPEAMRLADKRYGSHTNPHLGMIELLQKVAKPGWHEGNKCPWTESAWHGMTILQPIRKKGLAKINDAKLSVRSRQKRYARPNEVTDLKPT